MMISTCERVNVEKYRFLIKNDSGTILWKGNDEKEARQKFKEYSDEIDARSRKSDGINLGKVIALRDRWNIIDVYGQI